MENISLKGLIKRSKRSWPARYLAGMACLAFGIFLGAGMISAILLDDPVYFWPLLVLAFLVSFGILAFGEKWKWVCSKCGKENLKKREKHCKDCGGRMQLERVSPVRVRYCENGHRIKDFGAKMCPKCGKVVSKEELIK